jgi:hypothetical protein
MGEKQVLFVTGVTMFGYSVFLLDHIGDIFDNSFAGTQQDVVFFSLECHLLNGELQGCWIAPGAPRE